MKSIYLYLSALLLAGYTTQAQISEARLPQSMLNQPAEQYIPLITYNLPDWETAKARFEKEEAEGFSRPFLFGLPVSADIGFPASGVLSPQPCGGYIWRAQVSIKGAPAVGCYYNKFVLPEGVSYFLTNENGRHILGAYTSRNNSSDQLFAHEAVQGELLNLELDIAPGVALSAIQLHIDKMLVYFRSYEYLDQYLVQDRVVGKPTGVDDLHLEGSGSLCHINAICPLGINYPVARKATVQTLYPDGGLCSATMINNTGNTTADCKQYLLTATHCESGNSTADAAFAQVLIRYNFEKKQCGPGVAAEVNTLTGAYFRARANYVEAIPPSINGDFLLLEVKDKIPDDWDVYFAGWNRGATMPATLTYPQRYISFHHPAGDVKKVTAGRTISPDGDAGGSMGPGTHWELYPIDSGGIEPGSSGSGLFDGDGRLIGIASVAGGADPGCALNGKGGASSFYTYGEYSKLSLDWDYTQDGGAVYRRLKPWLDPLNSGVLTLDAVKSDCTSTANGIVSGGHDLTGQAIAIAPNPVTAGKVTALINLKGPEDLMLEIYNITGSRKAIYHIGKVQSGAYTFDLEAYAAGMYLLKFSSKHAVVTKKIMLSR